MNIKRKIKKYLPDRVIYQYEVIRLVPKYLKAKLELKNKEFKNINIISNEETVNRIIYERKSLSRFGDGEFLWILNQNNNSFQNPSEELKNDLIEVITSDDDNLLIGIPGGFINPTKCNFQARFHWTIMKNQIFSFISNFLDSEKKYSDASITRPYIDYRDREYSTKSFKNLKRIWNDRNIVIIEGKNTKLGLGNDLFSNSRSIKRIICPSENAYEKIDLIIESIVKNVEKDKLLIGALGPCATILAYKMSKLGYQFVDIGHIDIEYMWYLNHEVIRKPIQGKSVNESGSRSCDDFYGTNSKYIDSIIDEI